MFIMFIMFMFIFFILTALMLKKTVVINFYFILIYYIYIICLGILFFSILIYILTNCNDYIFLNNIDDEIMFDKVIIEDAKGYLDIYINYKGRKKKLRSYPVEFMITYDYQAYDHKNLLLEQIIKSQLKNIELVVQPQAREMWSPSAIGGIKSGWLKGEMCSGYYKKKFIVKFSYFLQDAYGYELKEIYKSWPALNRIMGKNIKIEKTNFYYENFELAFSLEQNTLKVRKGFITKISSNYNLLLNYYNESYKRSANCFFYRSDSKNSSYQVLVLENYTETFYNDIFKKKKKNLKYLRKIYKNLNLEAELVYFDKYFHFLEKYYK